MLPQMTLQVFEVFLLMMPVRLDQHNHPMVQILWLSAEKGMDLATANVKLNIYSLEFLTPENRPSAIPKVVFQSSF